MTQSNPNQIQNKIDRTREDLSSNVNALADKVSPNRIVGRRVRRTRAAVTSVKERVMGASAPATDTVRSTASTAGDAMSSAASTTGAAVSSAASTVADATKSAPTAATRQAQGNPIAAGLIAFGVGWLASSLMPASKPEQQIAEQVKDKVTDAAHPLVEQAQQSAKQVADNLQQPAHEALDTVRSTAQDAASTVTDEAKGAAADVAGSREVRNPRGHRSSAAINLIPIRSAP